MPDGREEEFLPLKNADGYYVLADRAVTPQHNRALNQFYVKDIEAVAARLRRGGVSLRMRGALSGQPNLISAREIRIEDDPAPPADRDGDPFGDPFLTFTEWSDAEDEAAFRDL